MDKKYYIHTVDTFTDKVVKVEVSKEVFETIKKSERKERYFSKDLKKEKIQVNQKNQTVESIKSREDSFERLIQKNFNESSDKYSLEDVCERHMLLTTAIFSLNSEAQDLIYNLYFKGLSEREYSKMSGIPQKTISNRKKTALKQLRQFLKE